MINGNAEEFIDRIYTCQGTVFAYNGIKYWFQGYMLDENAVHMEAFQTEPAGISKGAYFQWQNLLGG